MRKASELKFYPIKFDSVGVNGNIGTKTTDDFFRSALSQNICYCVRNTAKTVNEIADDLGVSPVYVESEAAFLEEYGLLLLQKDRYIVNFLISEPTAELLTMQDRMYKKAAELFANDLYDELLSSGILEDGRILCHQSDKPVSPTESSRAGRNFLLWSLIPYIAAWSGESLADKTISFEEVSTIRPDGGQNIIQATVLPEHLELPEDYVYMERWCGPMWNWNENDGRLLWQANTKWSDREEPDTRYSENAKRVLALYGREKEERLSRDEYAWLAELGYVKTNGEYEGKFKAAWQILILEDKEIQQRLIAIGDRIKEKHKAAFDALKAPYEEAALRSVPAHLRKIKRYELQSLFQADGWFIAHCVQALLNNGKLKEPTEGQRKVLTTIIAYL